MQKTLQTPTQVQFCSLDIRIGAFWPYCKSRKVSSCSNPNPPHKEKGWCLSNKEDLVQNVPTLGNPCILALAKRPQLAWQIPLEVTFFLAFQNLIFLWLCRCDTSNRFGILFFHSMAKQIFFLRLTPSLQTILLWPLGSLDKV